MGLSPRAARFALLMRLCAERRALQGPDGWNAESFACVALDPEGFEQEHFWNKAWNALEAASVSSESNVCAQTHEYPTALETKDGGLNARFHCLKYVCCKAKRSTQRKIRTNSFTQMDLYEVLLAEADVLRTGPSKEGAIAPSVKWTLRQMLDVA